MAFSLFKRKRQADDPQETRVASRGRRDSFASLGLFRMPNPDPTLRKYAGAKDIALYSLILQEFPFVAGYCQQWCEHVLVEDVTIKPAKADTPEDQAIADAAAARMRRAWDRIPNPEIVLLKALMMRFFGFARLEKVATYDPIVNEWIDYLYDVPQESWAFDSDGSEFLKTTNSPIGGTEVDPGKFIHFQWGSVDTKYGEGDLSKAYLPLWKMQQIEEYGLQAVEDYSKLIAIALIPNSYSKPNREKFINSVADQYRYYVTAPTDDPRPSIQLPTVGVTANGMGGHQEYEVLRYYERWIQILLLGAPQTQDKQLGTGKVEETRKVIWDDKTPIGRTSLYRFLSRGWGDSYCDRNLADVAKHLRPFFASDSTEIESGLNGGQAANYLEICRALARNEIPHVAAEEGLVSLGIPRPRAIVIATGIVKDRDTLTIVPGKTASVPPAPEPEPDADEEETETEQKVGFIVEDADGRPSSIEFSRSTMVMTEGGEMPAEMMSRAPGAQIVTRRLAAPKE